MPATHIRHVVLWLTFLTAMIMYVDRVCIGTAALFFEKEYGFNNYDKGLIFAAFSLGYALFQIPGGWAADRFGSRRILTLSLGWWSAFTALTAAATGVWSMAIYRFLFGVGEAAAFPAASRALVRWLPVRQRAFGQGFQHAGSRFGAAITPPLVVAIIAVFGWRSVFVIFGVGGILWAAIWYWQYRDYPEDHPGINGEELEVLKESGFVGKTRPDGAVPWPAILRSRNLWALSLMYFCYGWVLWMSLTWLPTYLRDERGFSNMKAGIYASIPLFAATLTNIIGGWVSDHLARRWKDLRRGRLYVSCTGFFLAGSGLIAAALAPDPILALALLSVSVGGLELTVAVSWAICLDIGGSFSGSVSGVMNTLGNLGGSASSFVVAYLATQYGWTAAFLTAAALCLAAALIATQIDPSQPVDARNGTPSTAVVSVFGSGGAK
jgi:MFS family permease